MVIHAKITTAWFTKSFHYFGWVDLRCDSKSHLCSQDLARSAGHDVLCEFSIK